MTILSHPDDTILLAYTAGALSEAHALVVATHLSLCPDCRSVCARFDALGGDSLLHCGTVAMKPGGASAALAMAKAAPPSRPRTPMRSNGAIYPRPLRDYIGADADGTPWKPIGLGARQCMIRTGGKANARLLYIPAGAAMPDHSHGGLELTLVLQGAFTDEDGRYARGDMEVADASVTHKPVAEPGEDCICLAATDAPLEFSGWMPRLAQRFLGI